MNAQFHIGWKPSTGIRLHPAILPAETPGGLQCSESHDLVVSEGQYNGHSLSNQSWNSEQNKNITKIYNHIICNLAFTLWIQGILA